MHVVITGASSGIGEALAYEYSSKNARLSLVARSRDKLQQISTRCNELGAISVHTVCADLSDPTSACRWLPEVQQKNGPIEIFVNNAGAQIVGRCEDASAQETDALMTLNLLTPLRLIQHLLPEMLSERRGSIVNLSSMAAVSLNAGMLHYTSSKSGLAAASESLRVELRGTGVNVLTVYPGPVRTPMGDASFDKHGLKPGAVPTGTPEGLARLIARAVVRRRSRVVYPRVYWLGWWFPGIARIAAALARPSFCDRIGG